MILIKGFFRKTSTKVYLLTFSFFLAIIITVLSFANYYTEMLDKMYRTNSFMVVISKNNYYDKLTSYKDVMSVDEAILFVPNTSYDSIVNEDFVEIKNGKIISSSNNGGSSKMNWEDFMIGEDVKSNFLLILPSSHDNIELKDNEIALSLDPFSYYKKDIAQEIIGEKIGFYYNNQKHEYTIKTFYETNVPGALISSNSYNSLAKDKKEYAYIVRFKSKNSSVQAEKSLKKLDKEIEVYNRQRYYSQNDDMNSAKLIDLISSLELLSKIIVFAFGIIFIIIVMNIINDSKKNIMLEKKLGYSNKQIKKYLSLNLISLVFISLLIASLLSIVINLVINNIFQLKLIIFDYFMLFNVYLIMITITFIFCLFYSIKKLN